MRQDLRNLKRYSQIALTVVSVITLQACSASGTKVAMDYLPDSAKMLIDKDIEKGEQVESLVESISVQSMLSSILGLKVKEKQTPSSSVKKAEKAQNPITVLAPIDIESVPPLKAGDYEGPIVAEAPAVSKETQEPKGEEQKVLEIIHLSFDEQTTTHIKQTTKNFREQDIRAEIFVGPLEDLDNAQFAALKAMVKAGSIGQALKSDFADVSIKFDPLQPMGTLKVIIKGRKHHA